VMYIHHRIFGKRLRWRDSNCVQLWHRRDHGRRSAPRFFLIVNDRMRARLSLIRSLFFPVMRAPFPCYRAARFPVIFPVPEAAAPANWLYGKRKSPKIYRAKIFGFPDNRE